ncbi:MAG: hypothetical protein H0X66_13135 [Verrucomicrobia bacterium]|nr:hypothetical protein [Verrucomicrobiota bacterium]
MIGKPNEIKEFEARDEIERVFHEIRQVLRVSGVNLNFRTWASFEKFLPAMWDDFRPNAETHNFERAADEIRQQAVESADALPKLNALDGLELGGSRSWQIQQALDLYHYINPKLLVLTAAVRGALEGEEMGGSNEGTDVIEAGVPATMYAMEMVDEKPKEKEVRKLFADIKKTMALSSVNSDYRTLALWPDYLSAAWKQLKPITRSDAFQEAAKELQQQGRTLAKQLPYRLSLTRAKIEALGEDVEKIMHTTQLFEQLLPPLILNIALLQLDWSSAAELRQSPFPGRSSVKQEVQHAMA